MKQWPEMGNKTKNKISNSCSSRLTVTYQVQEISIYRPLPFIIEIRWITLLPVK